MFNRYVNQLTVMGEVKSIDYGKKADGTTDLNAANLVVTTRSGDTITAFLASETIFSVLKNVDEQDNNPLRAAGADVLTSLTRLVKVGQNVILEGMRIEDGGKSRYDCRTVHVLYNSEGKLLFEAPHWWISQIQHLCDELIGTMWSDGDHFDYSKYRTNLGITGAPSSDGLQEIETLGRLLYGFATSYLLTGNDRYLEAARAGVDFQRRWFRNVTHDGKYVLWASWKNGSVTGMGSRSGDDTGTIPAYEQIYGLAGLTQYYRVTLEPEALLDIRRTVAAFDHFFLDRSEYGGYFSHLDPSTMTPTAEVLGENRAQKNWNSVGDHIPAYLVNLLLALKPLPRRPDTEDIHNFVDRCEQMLERCSTLIVEKFPDPNPAVPYVRERFDQQWNAVTNYSWQQDRAVCGHNLKIAWNLTRVAHHYFPEKEAFAKKLVDRANTLGTTMAKVGTDQIRGGVYDCVERNPKNGEFIQFAWWNTRDFWQQEQGILAYLILYGMTKNEEYLSLARETMAFWNAFFLDHDTGNVYFRVDGNGSPVLVGADYRNQTGHAKSGYHCFELCYLAHVYICTFVTKKTFSLNFKPGRGCGQRSINVLPDFMRPGTLRVIRVNVNGLDRESVDPDNFKIELGEDDLDGHLIVELQPVG